MKPTTMTNPARKSASADPYRFVATLYAHEAQAIAAGLLEARRKMPKPMMTRQPQTAAQLTAIAWADDAESTPGFARRCSVA